MPIEKDTKVTSRPGRAGRTLSLLVSGSLFDDGRLPVLTLLGLSFATLLTGAALVESVYSWDGVGSYAVEATRSLDFPAVYGTAILGGLVFLIVNLVTDILYGFVDPRVRLS